MKFQNREHQRSVHNTNSGKFISPADVRHFPHLAPKCSAPIDQANQTEELCKAMNNFSLQEAVAGVSGEENLVAAKETSNKKVIWNKE